MHILVATGGGRHSTEAVQFAAGLTQLNPSAMTLLTVVKNEAAVPHGRSILQAAQQLLPAQDITIMTKMRRGHAADEIVHEVQDGRYDLVILGERSSHDLLTRLLGPTARRVIEHVTCPVLIAKGRPRSLQHVLLCDSGFRPTSLLERLRQQLPTLLTDPIVAVTVLHVMSQISAGPGVRGHQLRADATALMEAQAPEGVLLVQDLIDLKEAGVAAEPMVRHGLVVDEIVEEAKSGNYDLIVIGAHRSEGWQRLLLDDLTQQIIEQADRSVLIVH